MSVTERSCRDLNDTLKLDNTGNILISQRRAMVSVMYIVTNTYLATIIKNKRNFDHNRNTIPTECYFDVVTISISRTSLHVSELNRNLVSFSHIPSSV